MDRASSLSAAVLETQQAALRPNCLGLLSLEGRHLVILPCLENALETNSSCQAHKATETEEGNADFSLAVGLVRAPGTDRQDTQVTCSLTAAAPWGTKQWATKATRKPRLRSPNPSQNKMREKSTKGIPFTEHLLTKDNNF